MRIHRRLVVLGLVSLSLLGCGARQKGAEAGGTPKPPGDPWSWVPEDATLIGRADLDRLRATPLWPLWTEAAGRSGVASWVDLAQVATVTFGGTGDDAEHASYIAALEGRFREDTLRTLAGRDGVVAEQRGLLTTYRRPDGVWTQISDKLIVTASIDRIDALVSRASRGGVPVKDAALYHALAERIALTGSHLALAADDATGSRRAAIERDARRLGLGSIARDAKRLGVGLETGTTYRLVAVAEAESAARAETLASDVRSRLDALSSHFLVRMLGISPLLEGLKTSEDGNFVVVRGNIDEAAVSGLFSRLEGASERADAVQPLDEP
jgi:hypothetical protein